MGLRDKGVVMDRDIRRDIGRIIKVYRTNYPANDELAQLLDELDTKIMKGGKWKNQGQQKSLWA